MKKQKPPIKMIRTQEDIDNLKLGDVVKIRNYYSNKSLYYAISMDSQTFISRTDTEAISEVEIVRGHIIPILDDKSGAIYVGQINSIKFHNYHNARYQSLDKLLTGVGL